MRIAILMSTYNGELYLKEQLDSIFNQTNDEFELFIRDDGSSDNTLSILRDYKSKYNEKIHLVTGNINLGAIRSYEWLINKVPNDFDYYAFADQDDIWYKEKLSVATNILESGDKNIPQLYICNQNCVNENGDFLYKRFPDEFIQPSIMNTMLNNQYSGCTMVFNSALLNRIRMTYKKSGKSLRVIYDVWVLAIAQVVGKVYFDKTPYLDFRRHSRNVTQASFGKNLKLSDVKKRFFNMFKTMKNYSYYKGYTAYRAKLLLDCFGDIIEQDEEKERLNDLATYNDSIGRWLRTIIINPLWKYYQPPKLISWLRFFVRIY